MTELFARRVRFWYGIFLSVFTAAMGIALFAIIGDIYFGGESEHPFTRELMQERFFPMIAPFCLWVIAVIAGFVLSVVFPSSEKRKHKPSVETTLKRLRKRIPQGEGEEYKAVRRFELARIISWSVCALVCLAGAIVSLVYLLNTAHFSTNLTFNENMIEVAKYVLPWVAAAFVLCVVAAIIEREAGKRELPYMKKLVATGGPLKEQNGKIATLAAAYAKQEEKVIWGARLAVLVLGVTFLILGIFNGGANDVFVKAIAICMECIGLG